MNKEKNAEKNSYAFKMQKDKHFIIYVEPRESQKYGF